jgi:hypothetical protein
VLSGSQAFALVALSVATGGLSIGQANLYQQGRFPAAASSQWFVSALLEGPGSGGGTIQIVANAFDISGVYISTVFGPSTSTGGIQSISGVLTMPANTMTCQLFVIINSATAGQFWVIDNVAMRPITPTDGVTAALNSSGQITSAQSLGSNLIVNPSFAGGLTTGWGFSASAGMGFTVATSGGHSSPYCISTALASGGNAYAQQASAIACIAGRSYQYQSWINANGTQVGFTLYFIFQNAAGQYLDVSGGTHSSPVGINAFTQAAPLTNGWQQVGGIVAAPPGAANMQAYLNASATGATGSLAVDDVSLYLLPGVGTEFAFNSSGVLQMAGIDLTKVITGTYSSDFTVSGGHFVMSQIDMSKAVNLSTQFTVSGGVTSITSLSGC